MMKAINKWLRMLSFHLVRSLSYKPKAAGNVLFITFDDGPEPGITEFVLRQLEKYQAKATFFCCGKNCKAYPDLYANLIQNGHALGNHTYSHISGLDADTDAYIDDIDRCGEICNSYLFRPPWGAITLSQYVRLRKKYNIVMWDVSSCDSELEPVDVDRVKRMWDKNVKPGSIILFHFRKKHEKATMMLLPQFLDLYSSKGYEFKCIDPSICLLSGGR